jgi:hypothetical protein
MNLCGLLVAIRMNLPILPSRRGPAVIFCRVFPQSLTKEEAFSPNFQHSGRSSDLDKYLRGYNVLWNAAIVPLLGSTGSQ